MEIKRIVNADKFYNSNTYIVKSGNECIVIDPVDAEKIAINTQGLDIVGVLVTHGHFDHCYGAKAMQSLGYPIYMSPLDACKGMTDLAKEFASDFETFDIDVPISEGEYKIGHFEVKVLNTSGHSKGSVVYIIDGVMFTGDTLFRGAYGRYDLFGGSFSELRQSLRKLFTLEDMTIYPGHNESSSLSEEKKHFFR